MSMDDEQLVETLQLARDLCIGIGAFVVTPAGAVRSVQSPVATTPDISSRIEALARACLAHPDARGVEPFWNAEVMPSTESGYDTLACVAVPLHAGGQWLGLLGVVDTWLPELDQEQRLGLLDVARGLAEQMAEEAPPAPAPAAPVPGPAGVAPEAPVAGGVAEPSEGPRPVPVADLDTLFPEIVHPPTAAESGPPPVGVEEPETPAAARGPEEPAVQGPGGEVPPAPPAPAAPAAGETPPTAAATPMYAPDSFLGEVADHLPDGLVVAREDGTIIFANDKLAAISGWAQDEILGGEVSTLLTSDGRPLSFGLSRPGETASLLGVGTPGRRAQVRSTTGRQVEVDVRGNRFASGVAGDCYVALLREATATQPGPPGVAEAPGAGPAVSPALSLLDDLDEGVVACDTEGTVVLANRAALVLQGLEETQELVGQPFPTATGLRSATGSPLPRTHHPLYRALQGETVRSEQLQVDGEDGRRHHLVASAKPIELPGGRGALLVLRDMTAQLEDEAWLMHLALHDPLTGLANRHLLVDYLRRTIVRFRTRGGPVALIHLDIDDFSAVNRGLGHDAGDELLMAFGRRLQGVVRLNDIVARLGPDEFVVAHAAPDDRDVDLVVARIRECLAAPFQVRGQTVAVTARIGWVSADPRLEEPSDLMAKVDRELGLDPASRAGRGA